MLLDPRTKAIVRSFASEDSMKKGKTQIKHELLSLLKANQPDSEKSPSSMPRGTGIRIYSCN